MELELLSGQRQSGESDNAVIACNDWLRMGPGRSLSKLLEKYTQSNTESHPTTSFGTLRKWSSQFNWPERATEFEAKWEAIKTAEREAEIGYGLALDYERVRKLKRLADFLETQIYEQGEDGTYHNVWVPDVKGIGKGEDFERIDIERFNPALFSEYRAVLEDLAKEVGGRVNKTDITSGGEPIIFKSGMGLDEL
jgi:hypothetical protein